MKFFPASNTLVFLAVSPTKSAAKPEKLASNRAAGSKRRQFKVRMIVRDRCGLGVIALPVKILLANNDVFAYGCDFVFCGFLFISFSHAPLLLE